MEQLTQDEQALLDSVEAGEWKRIPNAKAEAERYQQIARSSTKGKGKNEN
jgi:hypothetical protein